MDWNQALERAAAKLPATLLDRTRAICSSPDGRFDAVLGEIDAGGLTRARCSDYLQWLAQDGVPWSGSERATRAPLQDTDRQRAERATARVRAALLEGIRAMQEMQPATVPAPVAQALAKPGSVLAGPGDLTVVQDWVIDTGHAGVYTLAGTTQATTGPRPI